MIENMIITKILSANSIEYRSYINHSKTNRPCCALLFKIDGETVYSHNGINYITNRNSCIFLPKGIDYSFSIKGLGLCYSIEFEILNNNDYYVPLVFHLNYPESVIKNVEELIKYWDSSDRSNAKCMYEIYKTVSEISTHRTTDYSNKSKEKIINNSIEYMNKHYLKPNISNSELASVSKISEVYFRKIFTDIYGVSPNKYIIGLRIKKAIELLSSDYSTIEDVALSSGFTNVYHFIKTFKATIGCTPSEYAKSHRKNANISESITVE